MPTGTYPRRQRRTGAALTGIGGLAALAVLAGCGTTVPLGAQQGASGAGGLASGGAAGGAAGTAAGGGSGLTSSAFGNAAASGVAPGAAGGVAGGDGSAGAAGSSSVAGGAAGAAGPGGGPGVTPTTITIGVSYYQSAKQANDAVGARGVDTGDPVAATRILINDINRHGGIAGRQVKVLTFSVDPQSSQPYASEGQAACTYFTEDHKVFAVIDGAAAAEERACLAKHGVSYFSGKLISTDIYPNEIDAYAADLASLYATLPDALTGQKWFDAWDRVNGQAGATPAKLGIVTSDDAADNRAVDGVLVPALRRLGHAPASADVIRLTPPTGFGDDGALVAAIDNAVLRLNADGVDHVILNDPNGSLSLLFNNYAFSQHYFPRYAGTTGNAWQVLLSAGDIQAKTLAGAAGIGWQPLFDVPYQSGDGVASNAARHRCFALFAAAGSPHTDASSAGGQAEACDVAFLLPALFRGFSGPLTLSSVLSQLASLGGSYPLASGFASRFIGGQRTGTAEVEAMHFDGGCGCIAYQGPPLSLPTSHA